MPTEVIQQAAAPSESVVILEEDIDALEEAVRAKRKKASKRVFTNKKPGVER